MPYFLAGIAVLGLLLALGRIFVTADPRSLVRAIRYAVGAVLIAVGAVFLLAGRFAFALPLIVAGVSAIAVGRIGPLDLGGRGARSRGTQSTVRSAYLAMTLDHDSGAMSGTVLKGTSAGRSLDDLALGELLSLRDEVAADPESLSLAEAYLDRRIPGWREDMERDFAARSRRAADTGSMTDQEAYEILGLLPGAGEAEIRAAHRRLMKGVHPDRGGSAFLAARINQAKDRLLGDHR
jgi:hypothetical protein